MADFRRNIQDPSLGGLDQSASRPRMSGSTTAGDIAAVGDILQQAASIYGRSKANALGGQIGGQESFEEAGLAADQAGQELAGLVRNKQAELGKEVSADQAKDLRVSVFGKVLTNQKRIQSALERGLITSTEATARLNVLRNQALSNPLVAPFQDELDNALYTTTGGAGTTFAPTAQETMNAAAQKGKLQAIEEQEKQVTSMLGSGIASSRDQALNLIAQSDQIARDLQGFSAKKAALGASSQEVYANNQKLGTMQASSAYGVIAEWNARGGDAREVQSIQMRLAQEAEQVKQGIRQASYNDEGKLIVDSETLARQLAEVDNRLSDFQKMLLDQSGTKNLMDVTAQRTAALGYESQNIQIEIAKHAPVFYAMKDNPVASQWLWNNAVNENRTSNIWQKTSNPLLKYMGELNADARMGTIVGAADTFTKGGRVDQLGGAVLAETLPQKGGKAVVDQAYKANAEQTLVNLSKTPFSLKSLYDNPEWRKAASTPEGVAQVTAVVEGAASRALVSSMYDPETYDAPSGGRGSVAGAKPSFQVPSEVVVRRNEQPVRTGGGRGQGNAVGKKFEEWTIDTKGIRVSDQYKSEVVNAYKLGSENPQLWNSEFESVDAWINSLFARAK